MYALLRRYLPETLCDWIAAAWFAFLLVLVFVLWDVEGVGFHYIEL